MERARTGHDQHSVAWGLAYRALWAAFLVAAALNLLRVRGGFLTNYLADIALPALMYVAARGLGSPRSRRLPVMALIGRTPERTALTLLVASSATELSQALWPAGPFAGRFDPLDIVAYGVGVLVPYVADRLQQVRAQ